MKDRITARQMETTIALFLIGSSLISGSPSPANQDTWICLIMGFVLSVPMIWIHSQILDLYPGRNYFANIEKACGKPIGKVIIVLLIFYSFLLAAMVKKTFCQFIQTMNMPETPFIFILLCIVIIEFYMSKKRIYVVTRVSKFMFPFFIATVLITGILSFKDMDLSNLKPFLKTPFPILAQSTFLLFGLPFGESLICAPLFGALDSKEKVFPVFFKGMLLGSLILVYANLRNQLILGSSAHIFTYASYNAVSVIAVGDFFTRIEVIIGFSLLLAGFMKVCVTYFTCCQEVAALFGFDDYVPLFAPCGLILVTLIMLLASNSEEILNWVGYNAYFAFPFQVIIPIAVLITGKIRNRPKAKKKAKTVQPKKVCVTPESVEHAAPEEL